MFFVKNKKYKVKFMHNTECSLDYLLTDVSRCVITEKVEFNHYSDGEQYIDQYYNIMGVGFAVRNPHDRNSNRKIGREYAFLRAVAYLPEVLHREFLDGYLQMTNGKTYTDFLVPINNKLLPDGNIIQENGKQIIK